MERLGFGDFTIWTSSITNEVSAEIESIPDVGSMNIQSLVYAGYEVNGQYSDDEGQLLTYDESVPYRFINADGEIIQTPEIKSGYVYISPAMASSYDVEIGEPIQFEISRSNGIKSLTVAGYFADGFMGSSMIDMKSFLISETDMEDVISIINNASASDVLGKQGNMIHIKKSAESKLSDAAFYSEIQENTQIPLYTEFTYQKASILNYMLLLQNILAGFLLIFSVVLFTFSLVMISHNISGMLAQQEKNIAILKMMGLQGDGIRNVYLLLYGVLALFAIIFGMIPSGLLASQIAKSMVSSTGFMIQIKMPVLHEAAILLFILLILYIFLWIRTKKVLSIAPIQALHHTTDQVKGNQSKLRKRTLVVDLALREVLSGWKKYISVVMISALLVLFLSVVGKMGTWLGPNGEGLMNSFSVAEHDLGVQPFNNSVPMDEIERVINWYSPIEDTYELAMESVTLNGHEYTANVLDEVEWFHVIEGNVCDGNSILITDTVASEQDISIGDSVVIAADGRMESYIVSGIYQCANGMGSNIGMSKAGYSKIGDITGYIWCKHYILQDGSVRDYAMKYLQEHYQGIDVHTNSWSGLAGIVQVMHLLIIILYLISAFFILVATALVTSKLIQSETGNMEIYRSMGLSAEKIRISFSLRFVLINILGVMIGLVVSQFIGNRMIGQVFLMFGIGEFSSTFSVLGMIAPGIIVPVIFFLFAWVFSYKISKISITDLMGN
ncbi:MAG: ABC transporter permease [Lachnospiraceae bacterium]|nr:ABC transporter permease [Lachnospiraceae bacterium]MDD3616018.1 ABC transporter permease [Lachnospiraceae bacterium]